MMNMVHQAVGVVAEGGEDVDHVGGAIVIVGVVAKEEVVVVLAASNRRMTLLLMVIQRTPRQMAL